MSAAWVRPFRLTPMPRLRLACFPPCRRQRQLLP